MHIIFCIPQVDNSGPSKGMVALANEAMKEFQVSIIYFKKKLDGSLDTVKSIKKNIDVYKGTSHNINRLRSGSKKIAVISFCFSSDLLCAYYFRNEFKALFIRGNLYQNYRHDYGILGLFFALAHYQLIRFYDRCFVLNDEERRRLKRLSIGAEIVPNCLDEDKFGDVEYNKDCAWDLVFVGNLNTRKRPKVLLNALYEIKKRGQALNLVIVGDGPLLTSSKILAKKLKIADQVDFVGRQETPYTYLARSRVFILPSISEGTSRALMEAAYHGNICVVRDLECNHEFSSQGFGFVFFKDDSQLADAILNAVSLSKGPGFFRKNLLPSKLRQESVTKHFIDKLKS